MRSAVYSGSAVLIDWHGHVSCRSRRMANGIRYRERDGVNAPVKVPVALSAQLDRLAITRNHDVIDGAAVSAGRIVVQLVTGNAHDDDVVRQVAVAA